MRVEEFLYIRMLLDYREINKQLRSADFLMRIDAALPKYQAYSTIFTFIQNGQFELHGVPESE